MSLSAYLSKNYLTADTATRNPSKKRKRKDKHPHRPTDTPTSLTFASDDSDTLQRTNAGDNDADDAPTLVAQSAGGSFRKAKTSLWQAVDANADDATTEPATDQAAADAIIASTAHENNLRNGAEDEEQPQVVGASHEHTAQLALQRKDKKPKKHKHRAPLTAKPPAEETAAHPDEEETAPQGGLIRAADLKPAKPAPATSRPREQHETIYRDATGRVVSVAAARAEARRAAEEKASKEKEEVEARQGDVQRQQREERRRELEGARALDVGRKVDDEEMNREMRGRERWDDPMAAWVAANEGDGAVSAAGGAGGADGRASGKTKKKTYKGPTESNRYGIRPGWRWDGVDRGSGFEADWFRVRNEKRNRDALEYAWQMDLD